MEEVISLPIYAIMVMFLQGELCSFVRTRPNIDLNTSNRPNLRNVVLSTTWGLPPSLELPPTNEVGIPLSWAELRVAY
jgi:hypothetical protein